jgi:acyl-CoA synthetase (AMP-forming)/AMP-acid ligase II
MLSHANLASNALTLKDYWGWRTPAEGGDVLIHALPIFHVHGLFVASHGALLVGAKMLWLDRFDPRVAVALLPRATVFMGVPTLYVRMLGEPGLDRAACRNMRLFISGSAPMLVETFEAWRERTGHTILERYGMSETAMLTSNPYRPKTASGAAARSAFRCPASSSGSATTRAAASTPARSAASRCAGRTSSRATGACPRRRRTSSPTAAGFAPATSARSTRAATSRSSAAART